MRILFLNNCDTWTIVQFLPSDLKIVKQMHIFISDERNLSEKAEKLHFH